MTPTPPRNLPAELAALDEKINALLPPRYQHCYETVSPTSMGSAGLIYGADGQIAWDRIWTSFCDLALAGGPPHRGKLLEPVSPEEVKAAPERQRMVIAEIDRAIGMTSGFRILDGYEPGWVGVPCTSEAEASWLHLAVNAENVSIRRRGLVLQLPAGPAFRPEKEIKNLVVALAKTSHYWEGHLTDSQQSLGGEVACEAASPAEAAADPTAYEACLAVIEEALGASGLPTSSRTYVGWAGVETADEEEAGWFLRALLVERVPVRREENALFLPVPAIMNPEVPARIAQAFTHIWNLRKVSSKRPAWRPTPRPR